MCTVSFIPRNNGYLLAMNRDEKLARVKGLLPRLVAVDGHRVLSPAESGGGTWIAANDTRAAFALINWYSVPPAITSASVSRGLVVQAVAAQSAPGEVSRLLASQPLPRINPFRLIGVFPAQREIHEWRWDLSALTCHEAPWISQQWISSGYNEPEAQRVRSETFRAALCQKSAGSLEWLRRLHRSHAPGCGPFSICMHRPDAASVSYTEICMSDRRAVMTHYNRAPCQQRCRVDPIVIGTN